MEELTYNTIRLGGMSSRQSHKSPHPSGESKRPQTGDQFPKPRAKLGGRGTQPVVALNLPVAEDLGRAFFCVVSFF
ncbi:hypothetical protein MYCTH_2306154 [Thermothelomyces thermophilus ATCC 42464]|uniref:Uncharacterized protein n=1 Tax=Thermothelomyces thermophilus (strain ATCC 42464 / BCRC 31852 / DSM 1799) TaxID=573729 RepID=G2QH07_THET4|nr:uncharacterized protein MYCTH_2306154 [Thermothelomyces thermophilus ATCC 42464]AEO58667.1 hypothetical protein MYCTH_2306154 [Thermothelomyces thermophilus ATCC 42464]